ncbi:AIG2-like protein D isoform X2 [Actinidia eriantha]|uniref:AIG2-like protein D isoform X2 n=1 Tax=Actinidia eriantha TaxID=165200 RepID=UPI00258F0133|nr:AIG2-like protein D isoform X2 [Actinidia eriantha]
MGSTSILGGSNPRGLHSVFVYGSLLADDVVRVLLKRVPESSPAVLNGFHRFSIKGRVYPAILPLENKKVIGKVLSGITAPEIAILDTFEDVEYERRIVEVSLMDSSQSLQSYAYVWANSNDPTLYGDWNFEFLLFFTIFHVFLHSASLLQGMETSTHE